MKKEIVTKLKYSQDDHSFWVIKFPDFSYYFIKFKKSIQHMLAVFNNNITFTRYEKPIYFEAEQA